MSAPADIAQDVVVREIAEDEIDAIFALDQIVFHGRLTDDERARATRLLASAHRIGTYEDGRLVGVAAALDQAMTIPGGEIRCWGLTWVGVLPTHRRRGILTSMLDRLWADALAADRSIVGLWVAEEAIYGRFGCGPATRSIATRITTDRPLDLRIDPDPRSLRMLDGDEALAAIGPFHERVVRPRRGGLLRRDDRAWRDDLLRDVDEDDEDLTPPRIVVLGPADDPQGYVVYRTGHGDEEAGTPGRVVLIELEAAEPAGEAALWSYLASIDLTGRIDCWSRPVDDPLVTMLADRDRMRVTDRFEALWLRLVDLPAALEARSWSCELDLVIEVADPRLPDNDGRWRLRTAADGSARCVRTDGPADIALAARDLASAYLGGIALGELGRAGLVEERTAGAIARLDDALRVERAPFGADAF